MLTTQLRKHDLADSGFNRPSHMHLFIILVVVVVVVVVVYINGAGQRVLVIGRIVNSEID